MTAQSNDVICNCLLDDDGGSDASSDEIWSEPDQSTLESYQILMRSRLPSIPPAITADHAITSDHADIAQKDPDESSNDAGRPMTKAEKQNAKKKRRKERERMMKLGTEIEAQEAITRSANNEGIPFRLYSTRPIEAVQLSPSEEDYPVPPNPRHMPFSTAMTERITHIAEISAYIPSVDLPHGPMSTRTIPISHPQPLPPLIHVLPSAYPSSVSAKSGHIPRISLSSQEQQKLSTRQRRRIRKNDAVQAKFWAPEIGIGGKSRGYGWGWRSSEEGRREEGKGYLRSKGV